MFHATLKKIESNHNNLRTETVTGLVPELPVVGKRLFMYSSEVLTPGAAGRFVYTSEVQEVRMDEQTGDTVIRTENSLYTLSGIRSASPTVDNDFEKLIQSWVEADNDDGA